MHILGSLPAGFLKDQRGAALLEYALLLALISIVCILAVNAVGAESSEKFSTLGNSIAAAGE